jgi:hypothetical protein
MSARNRNICIGLLVTVLLLTATMAVGTGFARFQAEESQPLVFIPSAPGTVYLGAVATPDEGSVPVFDHQRVNQWERVEGGLQLPFTVANGISAQSYTKQSQRFTVQLIGSLGLGDPLPKVELQVTEQGSRQTYQGIPTGIAKGSALYQTYGEGWVFQFYDEAGEKCAWLLSGECFSTVEMTLKLTGGELTELCLLQPVIEARP